MSVPDYKINYKSDFVLTINGDAGWAIPFCIKFWTGMPSQAYFVGFDGVKYVNCRVGDTPTQLLVMFDDHHLPIGPLRMQIAYHTTIEEFPGSVFDEVTNARDVIVTIDGTDYQVLLDFTGEDAPELEFDLPAYANEAERIQNELQRQQNEADRIAAELQREQVTAAAVQGAENVNAQLNGTTLTVTNRQGVSTSVNTKGEQGEQGPVGPEGPQGEQGVSIVSFRQVYASETATYYSIAFSDGHEQSVAIPKGAKGDTGATGPQGPQGPQGQTGVSITDFVETGETDTATLYNITFSNGTTQQVAIPKGEKGDQGPQGPVGPQGPMGDVAVITPEQQAAFTMYSTTGQNTNGPMTQKAVTDNLVASSISYDNSQSGLSAENVQEVVDEVGEEILKRSQIFYNKLSISSRTAGFFGPHKLGFQVGKKYKVVVTLQSTATANVNFYLSEAATSNVNGISFISVPAGNVSASKIYNGDASHQYLYWWSGESVSNKFEISVYEIVEGALQDVYKNLDTTNIVSTNTININANQVQIHVNNPTNIVSGHLYKVKVSLPYAATSNILINLSNKTDNRDRFLICQINVGETTSEFNFLSTDNTHVWLCTYSAQSISGVVVEFYDCSEFSAESITNLNDAIYGLKNKYVFSVSAGSNTLNIDGLWDKEKLVLISVESDDITFGEAWFAMTYNGVEESGCLITYGIGDTGVYKFTDDCTHIKVWCSNVSGSGNLTIVIQDAGLDKKLPVRFGNISIIGDSYSTYKYWIPNNNPSWYCTNGIDGENAMTNDVSSVMQTWWYKLCQELQATLLLNDSYSGAPICNYAYNADQTSKSFVTRMKSCLGEDKALLPKPDIIIIFGGTNDDWGDSVVGSVKYGNWTTEDLNQVLPSVCYMFDYIKKWNPSAIIINIVNSGLDNSISDGMAAAAEHYNIYNLPLLGIGKTSQHPNISGMNAIKNQIISFIRKIVIG